MSKHKRGMGMTKDTAEQMYADSPKMMEILGAEPKKGLGLTKAHAKWYYRHDSQTMDELK